MAQHIYRSPQSRDDILDYYLHLAEDNTAIAEAFIVAVDERLDALLDQPKMGVELTFRPSELHGMRMFRVSAQFDRYFVFYKPVSDGIQVVRVLHRARHIAALFDPDSSS